jgi:hypothetical protein
VPPVLLLDTADDPPGDSVLLLDVPAELDTWSEGPAAVLLAGEEEYSLLVTAAPAVLEA